MEKLEQLEKENKFLKAVMRQYDKKLYELENKIMVQIEEDEEKLQNEERQDFKIYIETYNYLLSMIEEVEEEIKHFRIKKRNEIFGIRSCKMNNYDLKVGDTVNFIVGTSMLTGQIVKFYKGCFDEDECSVKTQWKTYAHIHLDRCEKVIDTTELQSQLNQQKAMWNELKEWLDLVFQAYFSESNKNAIETIGAIMGKMQELEKGEKNVKD